MLLFLAVTESSWNSWLRLWPHVKNVFVSLTVLILSHTDDIINEPDQCIETHLWSEGETPAGSPCTKSERITSNTTDVNVSLPGCDRKPLLEEVTRRQ